ncbi:glycosyltransferase family 9 protein [Desulfonatronovibrio magnus]|uniref:glycosyltransferase family 9 protein n=1 Tax=Desulfonatronovibrio magnus TaxID=698827 RepID=UPI0005EB397D|nr:glycosyltransferase family 9 protein [Desulfonatronovibrio magnus]
MNTNTLIIQLARLGDLLQTSRLVKSLQQHSRVHLCIDKSLAALTELVYPGVEIHALHAHGSGKMSSAEIMRHNLQVKSKLSATNYELVVNLNYSGMNFALSRLFSPEKVRGYINYDGQEARHQWTKLFFRLCAHRRLSSINLMDFWGLYAPNPLSPAKVNPLASDQGSGIGVVMAGRDSRRSVPLTTLAGLTRAVRDKCRGKKIYLLGSSAEMAHARKFQQEISSTLHSDVVNLVGRTSLLDLAEVIKSLEIVLTPDTGTMHLAAHSGTKVLAFFLSSACCFETGPYGTGHEVFQAMPSCAPCVESRKCKFDLVCHDILGSRKTFQAILGKEVKGDHQGILYESRVDDLGVNYTPVCGIDQYAEKRAQLRELIRRQVGLKACSVDIAEETARIFFHENQWML